MDFPFALEGFFFEKVNWSTGQRVTFTFHYITYAPASCHTAATAPFACQAPESNSAPFAVLHVNDICRWTCQLLLTGSFSKRSTGRPVNGSNGSTGQRVTFTFTRLYMIADDARLNGSMGRRVEWVNGSVGHFHFHFHYIIYDSR